MTDRWKVRGALPSSLVVLAVLGLIGCGGSDPTTPGGTEPGPEPPVQPPPTPQVSLDVDTLYFDLLPGETWEDTVRIGFVDFDVSPTIEVSLSSEVEWAGFRVEGDSVAVVTATAGGAPGETKEVRLRAEATSTGAHGDETVVFLNTLGHPDGARVWSPFCVFGGRIREDLEGVNACIWLRGFYWDVPSGRRLTLDVRNMQGSLERDRDTAEYYELTGIGMLWWRRDGEPFNPPTRHRAIEAMGRVDQFGEPEWSMIEGYDDRNGAFWLAAGRSYYYGCVVVEPGPLDRGWHSTCGPHETMGWVRFSFTIRERDWDLSDPKLFMAGRVRGPDSGSTFTCTEDTAGPCFVIWGSEPGHWGTELSN